jgi:hypothetical protein
MIYNISTSDKAVVGEKMKDLGFTALGEEFNRRHYGGNDDKCAIRLKNVNDKAVEALINIFDELGCRGLKTQAKQHLAILNNPNKEVIKSLKHFCSGLIEFVKSECKRGWLYKELNDGVILPYLISNIEFIEADLRNERPAMVKVSLEANSPRSDSSNGRRDSSISFGYGDVFKKTIPEALRDFRILVESDDMNESYDQIVEIYRDFQPQVGVQFTSIEAGICAENHYSTKVKYSKNQVAKLVNDDGKRKNIVIDSYTRSSFWAEFETQSDMFIQIPFHPYILFFDLEQHHDVWICAHNVELYVYDKTLVDKLVLPPEHRNLIDILVDSMDVILDDFIAGKSGGSTILCMGEPGLGKTLTAEVYSEIVERPLYRVHSGQLGVEVESIDKTLKDILDRANRLNLLLLLDEADVYIKKRGDSLHHNAIVAAFLRKLEYFSGLCFMTTNRANDVDDAIKSRCIAMITYEYPTTSDAKQIWTKLSTQFKMNLKENTIDELVEAYPKCSGRDIKELLKLASKYNMKKGKPLDLETFRQCAMFRGLS